MVMGDCLTAPELEVYIDENEYVIGFRRLDNAFFLKHLWRFSLEASLRTGHTYPAGPVL